MTINVIDSRPFPPPQISLILSLYYFRILLSEHSPFSWVLLKADVVVQYAGALLRAHEEILRLRITRSGLWSCFFYVLPAWPLANHSLTFPNSRMEQKFPKWDLTPLSSCVGSLCCWYSVAAMPMRKQWNRCQKSLQLLKTNPSGIS